MFTLFKTMFIHKVDDSRKAQLGSPPHLPVATRGRGISLLEPFPWYEKRSARSQIRFPHHPSMWIAVESEWACGGCVLRRRASQRNAKVENFETWMFLRHHVLTIAFRSWSEMDKTSDHFRGYLSCFRVKFHKFSFLTEKW